jgi:putative transposase
MGEASHTKSKGNIARTIDDDAWQKAVERRQVVEAWLQLPHKTREAATEYADMLGCPVSTFYRWVNKFKQTRQTSSLVLGLERGNKKPRRIDAQKEKIISEVISSDYLTKEKKKPSLIVQEVRRRCFALGISPPAANTIRSRIEDVPIFVATEKRYSKREAKLKHLPLKGSLPGAERPLDIVQIDHTKSDLFLVDPEYREIIDRAWVTSAIDSYSRACLALYISFGAPSTLSTALCLTQAVLPKSGWLREIGVSGDWPMQGMPNSILVDNGRDFHSHAFRRGCDEYGITLDYRPVKQPNYGGTIERFLGTLVSQLHGVPGTTFSNTQVRGEYDSRKHACLTLKELERYLATFIVDVYHQRVHSGINMPPAAKFEQGIGHVGKGRLKHHVRMPDDEQSFLINFLPSMTRTVQRYGVRIDNITYYSDILSQMLEEGDKRKFEIRRDPRDISKVYLWHPEDHQYYVLPYRDISQPPMTIWELKHITNRIKKQGADMVDEDRVFAGLTEMRLQVSEAKKKTRAQRKLSKLGKQRLTTPPLPRNEQAVIKPTLEDSIDFDEEFDPSLIETEIKLR